MASELSFEKPLIELRKKIEELKRFIDTEEIDFSDEIKELEKKAEKLEKEIYSSLTPWNKTQIARHPERPTTLQYIEHIFSDFIELHGDRQYGDDPAIVGGIAKFNGTPVTVIGHQKGRDTKENIRRNFGMPHPEGYRKALRLMYQADKFKRPIICFIDTAGAYPGVEAEERGQSEAIARNLREMASLKVPLICIVTGEGGSGGALALGIGNHIHMLENAIYSVISPEGAAALLWKDASMAEKAANTMKITSEDALEFGIIESIIPEPLGGAHKDIKLQSLEIKMAIEKSLKELQSLNEEQLVEQRYQKFRKIGKFISVL
ncbi:acetyl-CoA carboxylase carboxyltransferase subunit alpha [Vulcanibacillus modesticaldus]|uniref:Acetyl-coenzyme A carboxylase carboxyl transferase subunit alpha n=1 Tax=Vulcanibacillus modesticaldus TaxID=337097 RepID=A0A1D2YWT2_9BACI|nr:acetyl-CoA carboxylase carboxyl transferase subunit alpha [Vulcanibacillus modesticaldus]OEG00077.1 acetyl-CoA carboxylase carboxyltransferase subunit alpha [Vulcanibacillus modesticaldus]